jgi:signal transduction histidine kinase
MRPGAPACWTENWQVLGRLLRLACLWASMVSLPAVAWAGTAIRIETAQMQAQPSGTFGPPQARPEPDPNAWRAVSLPHVQPRQLVAGADGNDILTAWYRVDVPVAAQAVEPHGLRLYLPRWQTIGQIAVYADDRLVFRSGAGPIWNGFNHPLWLTLDDLADRPRPQAVLLRIDHLRSAGSAVSSVWLGDEAGLAQRRWWREWLQAGLTYILSSAFLLIGLFAFLVWMLRKEALYGLFFATSALFFIRSLHFHLGLEPLPIPEDWFGWLTIHSLTWLLLTTYAFGFRLHGQRYPRLELGLLCMLVATTVVSMPPLAAVPQLSQLAPLVYLMLIVLTISISLLAVWAAWHGDSTDAKLLAAWNATNVPLGIHDWMLQNYRIDIEGLYLLPYHTIVILALFMFVVQKRYVGALGQVERANVDLDARLKARETELGESYARLRAIENEQVLTRERQRLMQDMHDGLGSSLMVALKEVESGHELNLAQVLRECIDDLKLAIDSLEPVQADFLLLLATLRFRLGSRLEQAGLRLVWNVQDVPPLTWLDPHSALHILRIVQEVLGNAVKHSKADTVTVGTRVADGAVVLSIQDNGCGFDAAHPSSAGRGLANITQRAKAIGATVTWRSDTAGTRFELALPR